MYECKPLVRGAEEVDLAFLLDATGSMARHIEGAKLAINGWAE